MSEVDVDDHAAVVAGSPFIWLVECANVEVLDQWRRGEREVELAGRRLGSFPRVVARRHAQTARWKLRRPGIGSTAVRVFGTAEPEPDGL